MPIFGARLVHTRYVVSRTSSLWSQNNATEKLLLHILYAIRRADSSEMPCHQTGYDRHDIHNLWKRENIKKQKRQIEKTKKKVSCSSSGMCVCVLHIKPVVLPVDMWQTCWGSQNYATEIPGIYFFFLFFNLLLCTIYTGLWITMQYLVINKAIPCSSYWIRQARQARSMKDRKRRKQEKQIERRKKEITKEKVSRSPVGDVEDSTENDLLIPGTKQCHNIWTETTT